MKVHFFTTQPFKVEVAGQTYSLSKSEKAIVIIAGLAGTIFLGIGAIFTFYTASYVLRQRKLKELSNASSKSTPTIPTPQKLSSEHIKPLTVNEQSPPKQETNSLPSNLQTSIPDNSNTIASHSVPTSPIHVSQNETTPSSIIPQPIHSTPQVETQEANSLQKPLVTQIEEPSFLLLPHPP